MLMLKVLFILCKSVFTILNHLWCGLLKSLFPIRFPTITFLMRRHPFACHSGPSILFSYYEWIGIYLDCYKVSVIRHFFFFRIPLNPHYTLTHIFSSKFFLKLKNSFLSPFVYVSHAYVAQICNVYPFFCSARQKLWWEHFFHSVIASIRRTHSKKYIYIKYVCIFMV